MLDHRVHVIGAEPAGLVAAINLAREGFKVVVYDGRPDIGHRHFGEFQVIENWTMESDAREFLESIGVLENFYCSPFARLEIFPPSMKSHTISTSTPLLYVVERGEPEWGIDQGLKRQALAEGVEFRWNQEAEPLSSGWVIRTVTDRVADLVVRGMVFHTESPEDCRVVLNDRIAPKGLAYLLVRNSLATFAILSMSGDGVIVDDIWLEKARATLATISDIEVREPRVFQEKIHLPRSGMSLHNGQTINIGDAVGFGDALWGFGLRNSMLSGYLAAVSIRTGLFYDDLCRHRLCPAVNASLANRWLFSHLGNPGYGWMIRRLTARPDFAAAMRRLYRPSRLKRLMLHFTQNPVQSSARDMVILEPEGPLSPEFTGTVSSGKNVDTRTRFSR